MFSLADSNFYYFKFLYEYWPSNDVYSYFTETEHKKTKVKKIKIKGVIEKNRNLNQLSDRVKQQIRE